MSNWLADRVYGKVINVERPGEIVGANVNGKRFCYEDGSIIDVPRAVMNTWNSAVTIRWKQVGDKMIKEDKPRVMFIEMPRGATPSIDEQKKEDLISDLLKNNPKARRA
jgi:hypothetical protein